MEGQNGRLKDKRMKGRTDKTAKLASLSHLIVFAKSFNYCVLESLYSFVKSSLQFTVTARVEMVDNFRDIAATELHSTNDNSSLK